MTRILIDTNIIIYREDLKKVPDDVQELLRILNEKEHKVVTHPLSLEEIKKDKNTERKEIVLSKLKTYSIIETPPHPEEDSDFMSFVGQTSNVHDMVDNHLLYCVYKNAVDFLITEDKKIKKQLKPEYPTVFFM
ncbi:PIN domain-containing protein [Methanophagales archaeon]|nr:MAG: PIN domain-containing protein [Methanophagales archaeon]